MLRQRRHVIRIDRRRIDDFRCPSIDDHRSRHGAGPAVDGKEECVPVDVEVVGIDGNSSYTQFVRYQLMSALQRNGNRKVLFVERRSRKRSPHAMSPPARRSGATACRNGQWPATFRNCARCFRRRSPRDPDYRGGGSGRSSARGGRVRAKTRAASLVPMTATSMVQASSSVSSRTPASVQIARVRS